MALTIENMPRVEAVAHTLAEQAMTKGKAFADKTFDKCSADTRARMAAEYMRFVCAVMVDANSR